MGLQDADEGFNVLEQERFAYSSQLSNPEDLVYDMCYLSVAFRTGICLPELHCHSIR